MARWAWVPAFAGTTRHQAVVLAQFFFGEALSVESGRVAPVMASMQEAQLRGTERRSGGGMPRAGRRFAVAPSLVCMRDTFPVSPVRNRGAACRN